MTAKYDRIGNEYDTTRRADPFLTERLAFHLDINPAGKYLDIACGSGNYTTALSMLGGRWSGIDQSPVMLEKARSKSPEVDWYEGQVDELPFDNKSFDGTTCTLAIHHFDSLPAAFCEIRRVLRGRFVLFTSTTEHMKGYWLQEYFPVAMDRSREQMPRMTDIEEALEASGLQLLEIEHYAVRDDLQDFFLYSGKHRPEMYLDPTVRRGISTFSSLADEAEIAEGCRRLEADIASGRIDEVIRSFENEIGDYCFVVCE